MQVSCQMSSLSMESINGSKILLYRLSLLSAILSVSKNGKFQRPCSCFLFKEIKKKKKEESSLADTVNNAKCLCKCNPYLSFFFSFN